MPNDDMSGSEDGQLRSPFGDDHMLSGDEEHDTDSLDIKPPQAHVSRESSGSRRKEKSKDKKHSKERRHKERYSDSGEGRDKEKDYHREGSRQSERKDIRRGNGEERYQKGGYEREDYMGAGSEKQRYHAKHYDRLNDDGAAGSRGNSYHHGNYHVHPEHPYHHQHHHAQLQMQHRQQRQEYYEHRRQEYHHLPQGPTDYHNQRHHQQQHNQVYEVSRSGGGQKYHDHEMEKRKYATYDQSKDPESLEQDLRSRLLSKRHKYVKDDSMEGVGVSRDDSYERLYEEREHERSSKSERHKARRLKERDAVIEVVDSPDAEENLRHSQRKKHKRHKEKHEKRAAAALEDIISAKQIAEKRRTPEDLELVARRAKLLAAEQEKEKRKEIARKELEARREMRRDRALDTLSPTAVAASVTAGLNVQIKRKKSDEEDKTKRKRVKKSKNSDDYDDEDVEQEDEDATYSSDDSRDDEEDSVSNSESDSDGSDYKKSSKSKKKKISARSDGEVSLPDSPLSIGELSKSPKKSKKKAKKKKHSSKTKYTDDDERDDEEEKHNKRSSRSGTLSLSLSRSRSRSRTNTPARSRSRSSHSSISRSSRSRSRRHSSEHSRSRSRSHSRSRSSSRSRSHSRTSRSRSLSKSRSRSHSRSRSRSEERDMKANSRKEEKEIKDKLSANEAEKKKYEDAEDLPATDDKGNPLPNYYPGIQGCRSVEEFQCLNRIEEGTYGVVYRAKDKRTNEIVALKRLKMEKEKEGFPITSLREINTLLKGQHPNIVTVREIVVGSNMDKIFIVMDYVEHDLKSLMETMKAKKQSFFPGEIKCLTQQLLRAVGHLHDNWILHRDLKTSNLLLSHKGILKVGDFGLAREYGSPLKKYTSLVVTLWYRAPELLLCSPEYSTPIDIWSVGCIFAEFLQMAPLFPGKSEVDELNRIFKELGTPNEKIWPGYNQLPAVKNMLSQNSQFADYPVSSLKKHFADKTSESGIDLLQGLLTYDPKQRLSADNALKHQYFKELPVPIDPSMFPTWPAKSELGSRKALASSPKPPSGGSQFKQLGKDDIAGTGSGGKIISGIITGNKKTSANTGFVLNAGIDQRQLAMGPGFNLKF